MENNYFERKNILYIDNFVPNNVVIHPKILYNINNNIKINNNNIIIKYENNNSIFNF